MLAVSRLSKAVVHRPELSDRGQMVQSAGKLRPVVGERGSFDVDM